MKEPLEQITENSSKLIITDIFGTTTPIEFAKKDLSDNLNKPEVIEQLNKDVEGSKIISQYGSVNAVVKAGWAAYTIGEKSHIDFKNYIRLTEVGSKIGYDTKTLKMPIFDDVKDTFIEIKSKSIDVVVFSSGTKEISKKSFESAGIDGFIKEYYSSAEGDEKEVGSKTNPKSYKNIVEDHGSNLEETVYIADSVEECDAARDAGIGTVYYIDRKLNNAECVMKKGIMYINDYKNILKVFESLNQQYVKEIAEVEIET